jgi:hypothetical protein
MNKNEPCKSDEDEGTGSTTHVSSDSIQSSGIGRMSSIQTKAALKMFDLDVDAIKHNTSLDEPEASPAVALSPFVHLQANALFVASPKRSLDSVTADNRQPIDMKRPKLLELLTQPNQELMARFGWSNPTGSTAPDRLNKVTLVVPSRPDLTSNITYTQSTPQMPAPPLMSGLYDMSGTSPLDNSSGLAKLIDSTVVTTQLQPNQPSSTGHT